MSSPPQPIIVTATGCCHSSRRRIQQCLTVLASAKHRRPKIQPRERFKTKSQKGQVLSLPGTVFKKIGETTKKIDFIKIIRGLTETLQKTFQCLTKISFEEIIPKMLNIPIFFISFLFFFGASALRWVWAASSV